MSLILVSPPSLQWANRVGHSARGRCYLDGVLKSVGGVQGARFYPIEHIGLGSIKAYASMNGMDVSIINGIARRHSSVEETFDAICRNAKINGDPILIGFSGPNSVLEENLTLARYCKAKWQDAKCILGHDFATLNSQRILTEYPEFDFICRGDGEVVFTKLSKTLLEGKTNYDSVAGLAFRNGTRIHISPPSALALTTLPWPARDDLHLTTPYGFAACVSSSRGCMYRCTFCTTGQMSALLPNAANYRLRSIEDVVDEIEYLNRDFKISHVTIGDDLFLTGSALSKQRAEEFASLMIRRNIKVHFMFDCRFDSIDLPLFRLLYKAGLRALFLGIETGDDDQRERYKKQVRTGVDVRSVIKGLIDIGLKIIPGMIAFHPDVTVEELKRSLDIIDLVNTKRVFLFSSRLKLYPGTPIYDSLKARGCLKKEWPVPSYTFKHPQAEELLNDMIAASADFRNDYDAVRAMFVKGLSAWENSLQL